MKYQLVFLSLTCAFTLHAQFHINFNDVLDQPCPNDPSVTQLSYQNWEIYQTEEDTWNGQRIETDCINLKSGGGDSYGVDLNTIRKDKALFMRYKMENLTSLVQLPANGLFNVNAFLGIQGDFSINMDDDCSNGLCSGVITILRIANDTDELFRRSDFPFVGADDCYIAECFVTEKTEVNEVREIIYKVTLNPDSNTDDPLYQYGVGLEDHWEAAQLIEDDILVSENHFDGTEYNFHIYELQTNWTTQWLLVHRVPGLPSNINQSVTYVRPEINSSDPKTINFHIDEYYSLFYQMFTQLQGGLVEGSDSLQHTLNIIQEGANLCLFIVEAIFEKNTNLVYKGGEIRFPNTTSCIQVRNNGKLVIGENQTLHLGNDGFGMLNLRSGGTIEFRENAHLFLDCKINLDNYEDFEGDQEIYIDLPYGSSLAFGPHTEILNKYEIKRLNIRMNGGHIDLSKLTIEDREKINLIYPEIHQQENTISVFPNPVYQDLAIYNPALKSIQALDIMDLQGRTVLNNSFSGDASPSRMIDLSGLPSGTYILMIRTDEGIEKQRIVLGR